MDYSEWLTVRAEEACQAALPAGQAVTNFDLVGDPRYLALEDVALAAPGTVPTMEVLEDLRQGLLGGLDLAGVEFRNLRQNIAEQLGLEDDPGSRDELGRLDGAITAGEDYGDDALNQRHLCSRPGRQFNSINALSP